MIKQTIAQYNITSHNELDEYLAEISADRYYYSYDYDIKDEPRLASLLSKCICIEFNGLKRFYEDEKI